VAYHQGVFRVLFISVFSVYCCIKLRTCSYVSMLNARARMCIRILVILEILSQALLVICLSKKSCLDLLSPCAKVLKIHCVLAAHLVDDILTSYAWSILIIVSFIVFSSITADALPRRYYGAGFQTFATLSLGRHVHVHVPDYAEPGESCTWYFFTMESICFRNPFLVHLHAW